MGDVVQVCPGLSASERGVFWRNSLGQEFDLAAQPRLSPGDVALKVKRSAEWVLRKVRAKQLYPVIYHNARSVEIYECAITDYYHRHTQGVSNAAA